MKRLAVLSVDGVPVGLWRWLMEEGRLPNFTSFAGASPVRRMRSVHPCESATAWTSYATLQIIKNQLGDKRLGVRVFQDPPENKFEDTAHFMDSMLRDYNFNCNFVCDYAKGG